MRAILRAVFFSALSASVCPGAITYLSTDQILNVNASRTYQGNTLSPTDSFTAPPLTPVNQQVSARAPASGSPFSLGQASIASVFSPTEFSVRGEILSQTEAVGFAGPMSGVGGGSVNLTILFATDAAGVYDLTTGGLFTTEGSGHATLVNINITGSLTLNRSLPRSPFWIENTEQVELPAGTFRLTAFVDGFAPLVADDYAGSSAGFYAALRLVPAPGGAVVLLVGFGACVRRRRIA
jgi:hypothetical protein